MEGEGTHRREHGWSWEDSVVRRRPQLGVYVASVKAAGRIPPRPREKEHETLSGNNIPPWNTQLEHS